MILRHSARGLVVDETDHLLLYRFEAPHDGATIWAPPGGGLEAGESAVDALARELDEETGLQLRDRPPHVWRQRVVSPDVLDGWDGVVNDYFLVRARRFDPRGSQSEADLAAELVEHFEWWSRRRLLDYGGSDLFSPRGLPRLFQDLLHDGPPPSVLAIGW